MKKTDEKDIMSVERPAQVVLANQLDGVQITPEIIKSEEFVKSYSSLLSLIDYLGAIKKAVNSEIKDILQAEYIESGENSVSAPDYTFTYCSPSTKIEFDTKKFQAEHPDLYKKYIKVTNVSDSLRVTKAKKADEKNDPNIINLDDVD